jgi:hypothetical protein
VVQGPAEGNVTYPPIVFEKVKGSIGLSGSFLIHVGGLPRLVSYEETALRFKRKLEEFNTVGSVYVERFKFPSNVTGGWSGVGVDDGTRGGYEWRIYYLSNTGTANGFSFPPGSGNVDPIEASVSKSTLRGTNTIVEATTYVQGSIPIDGAFTLAYNDAVTDPIRYDQMPSEMKYFLESTNTIGEVDVTSNFRMMQRLEGVYVTANKDSQTLIVEYDTNVTYSALNPVEMDIRKMLAAGDLFRIGGTGEMMDGTSQSGIDGADLFGLIEAFPLSPLFGPTKSASQEPIYPGETLRVGADDYSVLRTGVEVQTVSIDCGVQGGTSGTCGNFYLQFNHVGVRAPIGGSGFCIRRDAGGEMSSAADVELHFSQMSNVGFGDIIVTRTENAAGSAYVFSLYFQGPSVSGNVLQVIPTSCGRDLSHTNENKLTRLTPTLPAGRHEIK